MDVAVRPHSAHSSHEDAVVGPRRTHCEVEAPDRGDSKHEAPEARRGRQAEAPDAGEGRVSLIEHEFTHGRSQS
jgi:hypothetical protein